MPAFTRPQFEFLTDRSTPEIAFSGGMGAGKSLAGAMKALDLAVSNQGHPGIVWAPSLSMAKEGIMRVALQVLRGEHDSKLHLSLPHKYNGSTGYLTLFPNNKGGRETPIYIRSGEQDIVSTNAAWAVADELDTLTPDKARHAWQQLTQRIRVGSVNQLCATTTPEGYKFLWEYFVQDLKANAALVGHRRLITASLFSNPNVSDQYIKNLILSHTPEQQRARIHGEFVNLHSSRVYQYFDREVHHVDTTFEEYPNADLWVGMDFNIDKMAAVICTYLPDKLLVLDEIIGTKERPVRDTPTMISMIKQRYPNRRIHVCPDASGQARDTAGWATDLTLLEKEGWSIHKGGVNPAVELRVSNVNSMFYNASRAPATPPALLVNTKMCPMLLKTLEQQPYDKNDTPDKKGDLDHGGDALGYVVMQTFGARLAQARSAPWRH